MTGPSKHRKAAFGFRSHSGWACAVVLVGDRRAVSVVERRRIVLADPNIEGSKQPFHHAEPMAFDRATEFINRCTRATDHLAAESIAALKLLSDEKRLHVVGACLTTSSGRALPDLRGILSSHALIHTAEGEFYRVALAKAAEQSGLKMSRVRERDAVDWTASRLELRDSELRERLVSLGKPLGPPWGADEKLATMAAWLVLAE